MVLHEVLNKLLSIPKKFMKLASIRLRKDKGKTLSFEFDELLQGP
jgi:hypothetical protein